MAFVSVGIDLARNVLAVHGVDATGKAVLVRLMAPKSVIPSPLGQARQERRGRCRRHLRSRHPTHHARCAG